MEFCIPFYGISKKKFWISINSNIFILNDAFKKNISTAILIALLNAFVLESFSQSQKKTVNVLEFKNQGEQEAYWAQRLFQNEYYEQKFKRFSGLIANINNVYVFSKDSLAVNNTDIEIQQVFLRGLLYPSLIGGNCVSNVDELKVENLSLKKKRFKFLLYRKRMVNPTVCFFELTNNKSDEKTDLKKFISGASLTFFKRAWIMI